VTLSITVAFVSFGYVTSTAKAHLIQRSKHETKLHYAHRLIWHGTTALKWLKQNRRFILAATGPSIYNQQVKGHRWELRYGLRLKKEATPKPAVSSFGYSVGVATWYGPGFYGHSTSCGQILTGGSMWVASMTHGCGARVRICTRMCIETSVQDTGAFSATFDMAPGLARALGCYCTQTVRYAYH
jgi:rare lipoprotein A (peptidoglycan hydrolase)